MGASSPSSSDAEDEGKGSAVSDLAAAGVPRACEQPFQRMMVETQHDLVSRRAAKQKLGLATLRLDKLGGGRETITHQYWNWRKQVLIT